MDVFTFLKEQQARRHWNLTQLADACDVHPSLASRWVAEDSKRRVIPGPASCRQIALGLGVPENYVLTLAGHLSGESDHVDTDLRAQTREFERALQGVPRHFWRPVLEASIALARAYGEAATPVTDLPLESGADAEGPDKARALRPDITSTGVVNGRSRGRQRPIKPREMALA